MSRWLATAVLAVACVVPAVPATAQPAVTEERSPSGLAFRYAHMPEDSYQSLLFGWKDATTVAWPGKEALATLAPALLMDGPRGMSRSAMLEELRDHQASIDASKNASFTQISLTAAAATFGEAAQILARVLADPALLEDRLADMRRTASTSSRQASEVAETLAQRLLSRLILGDGPFARFATAEPASFERLTKADIEAWRRDVLVRDGLIIVAAGPMTAAEVGREIDRIAAALPQSGPAIAAPRPTLRAPGKLVVLERPVVQTSVAAGGPTSFAVTPELTRAGFALEVLGRAQTGRLFLAVRERLGAAYGISAGLQVVDANTRRFFINATVANDRAKAALAAIREEYARFVSAGVTDDEIAPLKTSFIARNRDGLRRAPAVAGALMGAALAGFPLDYFATYEQRIRTFDRATINDDIRSRLPPPPLTIVVVAPSAEGFGADCVIKAAEEIGRCE